MMDRLTGDFKGVSMFATVEQARQYNRLRQYEETELTPDEVAALRAENERLCAALKLAQVRAADYDADIEAGRLLRLPAAIGQWVYVPSGDGGVYTARVKDIGVLRPDAHDAIMRATVRVGLESKTLEYLIALENKGTHWFDTDEAARTALGKEPAE